jgi:alpha-tubulin suppressor-like RCC1 family protein
MNIGKLNLEISKAPSNLGEANVAAKSAQKLNDGLIQNVATVGDLPTASTNCGRQFFVTGDQELYFSDGTKWNTTLKPEYQLWVWGFNYCGVLGINNTTHYSTPQQEICGGTNWCMVSGGGYSSSSLKSDGTIWSWGCNSCGLLGTNNTTDYSTPQQEVCGGTNWCMVSGGGYHTSAIKTDGTLWSWGGNFYGRLGLNNTTNYSTPQQEVCGGTNWCMVSVGSSRTSAIKTDGTLWGWGSNNSGRLGTNDTINYSTPTQEACGGINWCKVSAGNFHTTAIKTDGTLWSWGNGAFGKLGTNNTTCYSTPTQEACGGTNWCMVSGGGNHTSAIKSDGTLWSWGNNGSGQLGTNNTTCQSTPQQEACGGTNWCTVNAGSAFTSTIKTDGTLWSWGDNYFGSLGTNNQTSYSTPTQEVCGFSDWCFVTAGVYSGYAIRGVQI